jgi:calcineurin-like phosphoesterase family protein
VVADTHFGHDNIIAFSARPDNHDELMLQRWTEFIKPDDVVLHLGDLCWCWNDKQAWFAETVAPHLTGVKYMLMGNHDLETAEFYARCGFRIVEPFVIDMDGWRLAFTHNPDEDWPRYPATINVHGHIHTQLMPNLRHMNLCVEWTDYAPVRIVDRARGLIALLRRGDIATKVPLPYDQWLVDRFGGDRLPTDIARWPNSPQKWTEARQTYTKYRLETPEPIGAASK